MVVLPLFFRLQNLYIIIIARERKTNILNPPSTGGRKDKIMANIKRFDDFTEVYYEGGLEIIVNHHCDENGDDIITKKVTNVAVNPAYDYEAGIDY